MNTPTLTRPAAPKVSPAVLEAATYNTTAVIVQDASGAVYCLERLTAAQAEDPDLTGLVDHAEALDWVARHGGRISAAARALTVTLASQHARGLL